MITYKNDKTWQMLQSYYPEEFRLRKDNLPKEYYINLGRFKVHIDHYPVENSKIRVILFHGAGGNGRLLSLMALPLQKAGIEAVCPDFPLYGLTDYKGKVVYEDWVECGALLVRHFQKKDNKKTFLLGLSIGGILAFYVASQSKKINGIIASCLIDQRDDLVFRSVAKYPFIAKIGRPLMAVSHKLIGNIKLPLKFLSKMNVISNNEKVNAILLKDKLSSGVHVPISFIHSMSSPKLRLKPENFTSFPVLLLHPEEDRWTDVSLSLKFFDRLGADKKLVMIKGAGHFPIEDKAIKQFMRESIEFLTK